MIRVAMDVPEAFVRRAEWVFQTLAQQWRIPVQVFHDRDATDVHVRYTTAEPPAGDPAVRIQFDQRLYAPDCRCHAEPDGDLHVWVADHRPDPRTSDIVASTYRLLTFLDEQ